jgi:methionyl-tRNA formyltransferase
MYGAGLSMEPQHAEPGTVVKIDDSGIHVALSGARLTIAGVRPGKLGKQAASQWAAEVGLEDGTRLGEP